MMAAITRLISLLSNKRGNKPDQDEIILANYKTKFWLLLVANGCWPLLSHCCWTPLMTRLQIAFVSSVLGLYWPFVPRPFVSPQSGLPAAQPLPARQKPYSAQKGNIPKIYDIFWLLSLDGPLFSPNLTWHWLNHCHTRTRPVQCSISTKRKISPEN